MVYSTCLFDAVRPQGLGMAYKNCRPKNARLVAHMCAEVACNKRTQRHLSQMFRMLQVCNPVKQFELLNN